MLLPESKSYHLSAAGELRPCAAYSDQSVRESPVFLPRKHYSSIFYRERAVRYRSFRNYAYKSFRNNYSEFIEKATYLLDILNNVTGVRIKRTCVSNPFWVSRTFSDVIYLYGNY